MQEAIGIKFRGGSKTYFFSPNGIADIKAGDRVVVETAQGLELATCVHGAQEIDDSKLASPLKSIVRLATEEDLRQEALHTAKEAEAFDICRRKIAEHRLDMNLTLVEYSFDANKITFYYTSDGRVDFRELVKDLAATFRTRIELRQIGVRDVARMLGGLGCCGRPICCATFLTDFQPVSIKMAKEQNLALSPTKISGACGRLMCCLHYEQHCYESMRKRMPKVGTEVETADGPGVVLDNNVLTERTKVKVTVSDGTPDIREYPYNELTKLE
ncbi:MAG: stage 0 sporulation family protein [Clostridia bacterium]|nr:stage 0 sporulation family protein [Clostridia bacterium]